MHYNVTQVTKIRGVKLKLNNKEISRKQFDDFLNKKFGEAIKNSIEQLDCEKAREAVTNQLREEGYLNEQKENQ